MNWNFVVQKRLVFTSTRPYKRQHLSWTGGQERKTPKNSLWRTDRPTNQRTDGPKSGLYYPGNKYMGSWRKHSLFIHWMKYMFKWFIFQLWYGVLIYQVSLFRVSMGLVYDFFNLNQSIPNLSEGNKEIMESVLFENGLICMVLSGRFLVIVCWSALIFSWGIEV